jgi:glycosyltransferase involved in cell wall biosynthesis
LRIAVVTAWHNEAMLAPFFLSHYAYADKIHIIVGDDTTDNSLEICAKHKNVGIEMYTFPGGLLDDILKAKKMSEAVARQRADWVYCVDADEFIFPEGGENPREVLGRQTGNVMYAKMWNVYRHRTDSDLDPSLPAVPQRRHGNPSFDTPGAYKTQYIKPIIVRPEYGFDWYPGNHMLRYHPKMDVCAESFAGAHWQMADERIAVARRIKGMKERLSETNLKYGMGDQSFDLTEEKIHDECERHLDDPILF